MHKNLFVMDVSLYLVSIEALTSLVAQCVGADNGLEKVLEWLPDAFSCADAELLRAGEHGRYAKWDDAFLKRVRVSSEPQEITVDDLSLLAVPIAWEGDVLGALLLTRKMPALFTPPEFPYFSIVANQLHALWRHEQMVGASWQQTGEVVALYQAVSAVSSVELSLNNVGKATLTRLIDALQVDEAVLMLWDSNLERLTPRLRVDAAENFEVIAGNAGIPPHHPILNDLLRQRRARLIPATDQSDEDAEDVQSLLTAFNATSVLLVPLHGQRSAKGIIVLISVDPDQRIDTDKLGFAATFSMHAAVAIEQGSLFDQAKRNADEMAILQAVALDIGSHITLSSLLQRFAERAGKLVNAAGTVISLLSYDDNTLSIAAAHVPWSGVAVPASIIGNQGFKRVIQEERPLVLDDYWNWTGKQKLPAIPWQKIKAVMAVPLKAEGEVVGVITVFDTDTERVFSQRDLYLLDMLAPQGAVAIRNAQLFMELEARMKELSRTQAQLLQSEKLASIGRMAGTMAHEVNNPLHSINNCLHIGLRSGVSAEKRTTYLKMARQEVQRLMGTVGQLLNFYRPAQSERERISVVELVNKVLALLDKQLSKQDIKINRKFEDVPPVWVVRDHIHQVLLNLLLNAADAMPQGGTIHVEITHPVGDEVAIFIIDEGPGIDAEMLPLIFEPFVTTKMQGTGLGLATSLSIIEAHGGQMRVTSQPNEGACFAVILPIISNSEALTV